MNHDMAAKKPTSDDVERETHKCFVEVLHWTHQMPSAFADPSGTARRLLAHALHMVAPDVSGEPPEDGRFVAAEAVRKMYEALGVTSAELREQVREVFGFREPPAPRWVQLGAVVRSKLGYERVIDAVCTTGGNTQVQLLPRSRFGRFGAPIAMGLFLAEYSPAVDHAHAAVQPQGSTPLPAVPLEDRVTYALSVDFRCVWARHESGTSTVFVDAESVCGPELQRVEDELRKLVPKGVVFTVNRSQMPALRSFAEAVAAAVASPQGQRLVAEWYLSIYARKHPAFALARRAVVMAMMEGKNRIAEHAVPDLLIALREYEDLRGIGREPSQQAVDHARESFGRGLMAIYERARATHQQHYRIQAPSCDAERRKAISDAFPRPDMSATSYFKEKSE